LLIELGLVTTAVGIGGALDRFSTPALKDKIVRFIKRSSLLDWHSYVAILAWKSYAALYGEKSTSARFILRSAIAYLGLIFISTAYLAAFDLTTYKGIVSVWSYGNAVEKLSWVICLIIGLPLYILANAQTLYFLEILKTTPNFFKFFLVAYADLLITSSIALFGIPAAMLACSYIDIASAQRVLPVEIKFDRMIDSSMSDAARMLDKNITDPELYNLITKQDKVFMLDINYSYKGSESSNGNDLDFYMTRQEILSGRMQGASLSADGKAIRQTDASGTPTGYRDLALGFSSSSSSFESIDGKTFPQILHNFCRKFSSGIFGEKDRSVLIEPDSVDINAVYSACTHQQKVIIKPLVRYNSKNVRYSQVYNYYLQLTLQDMISNITSGFGSYLTFSPYLTLAPRSGPAWFHKHNLAERENRESVVLDELLQETLFYDLGGYNWIINKGPPGGSINFAVFSTALFNIIVMSIFFIAFPIIKLLSKFDLISEYVTIESIPFTVAGAVVSIWVLLLSTALTLFL